MLTGELFAGIDVGTSYIKAVLIGEDDSIANSSVERSGPDMESSIPSVFDDLLSGAGASIESVAHTTSTGFGRRNVKFADSMRTEINCHARGAYHHFPREMTIIDIGGQDTKVIRLDALGKQVSFKMNRKCAAGTGAFLEEIAHKLDISPSDMNELASRSTMEGSLNSYCTVFASSEILTRIREGEKVEDMVRSAFESVASRLIEMDTLTGTIVMTGGVVEFNDIMVKIVERYSGSEVLVPPHPQLNGAFGAALVAKERAK